MVGGGTGGHGMVDNGTNAEDNRDGMVGVKLGGSTEDKSVEVVKGEGDAGGPLRVPLWVLSMPALLLGLRVLQPNIPFRA